MLAQPHMAHRLATQAFGKHYVIGHWVMERLAQQNKSINISFDTYVRLSATIAGEIASSRR
jgi:hypothetical protein